MVRCLLLLAIVVPWSGAFELDPVLVARAVDGPAREAACAELRALGPDALPELARIRDAAHPDAATSLRWDSAFDAIGQQRGCARTLLYWYTDLDAARAAAAASGRPILSLSLLGRLADERSCANSRLYRDLLYADPRIAELLRERVVLHWRSERPVPLVTIDLGDGRAIRTTVCGNSIHILLDADGRVVDAFPGLYAPATFLDLVGAAVDAYASLPAAAEARAEALRRRHDAAIADAAALVARLNQGQEVALPEVVAAATAPVAEAEALTETKRAMERPLLRAIGRWRRGAGQDEVDGWLAMAALFAAPIAFHPSVEAGLASRLGGTAEEAAATIGDLRVRVARDDLLDRCVLRPLALRELLRDPLRSRADFDRWAYDALFLTPASDPWLGLLPSTYVGLPHNGVVDLGAELLSAQR